MSNLGRMAIVTASVLSCALLAIDASGQQAPSVGASDNRASAVPATLKLQDLNRVDDFRPLFEERRRLIDELTDLDREIRELNDKITNLPSIESLRTGLSQAKRDLNVAKAASPPNQDYIESIQQYITTTEGNLEALTSSPPLLRDKNSQYDAKYRRLFEVEQRIGSLFDDTKDVRRFRTVVTITFGILVMFVIAGFYLIAWYKHGVAATIFSGEMGMQFITLFLIVIAIILFGIMGTLEGRELSALLGGLSGYILGRASDRTRRSSYGDSATSNTSKPESPVPPNEPVTSAEPGEGDQVRGRLGST